MPSSSSSPVPLPVRQRADPSIDSEIDELATRYGLLRSPREGDKWHVVTRCLNLAKDDIVSLERRVDTLDYVPYTRDSPVYSDEHKINSQDSFVGRLEENIKNIEIDVNTIQDDIQELKETVKSQAETMETMDERMDRMNERMETIQDDIQELKETVKSQAETMERMDERMERMDERMDRMDERMDRMNERMERMDERMETIRKEFIWRDTIQDAKRRNGLVTRLFHPVAAVGIIRKTDDGSERLETPAGNFRRAKFYWNLQKPENAEKLIKLLVFYDADVKELLFEDDSDADDGDLDPTYPSSLSEAVRLSPESALIWLFGALGLGYEQFRGQLERADVREATQQDKKTKIPPVQHLQAPSKRLRNASSGSSTDEVTRSTP